MAIDGFTVNGTALVYVGTGIGGALELLGYTDQGVQMNVDEHKLEIFSDVFGPRTPHDFQDMGMTARIVAPLIAMDRTVLASITGRGDRTTVGMISTPGLVLGSGGYFFRVGIASPADAPWSFSYCLLRPGFNSKLATKANPFNVEFFAWPFKTYTATNGLDGVLWTRSLA